jgi:xylulokinase
MSLLGLDIGTTGCKAVLFSEDGNEYAAAYQEYDPQRPEPGWAELDAVEVWEKIKSTIKDAAGTSGSDPVQAIAITSMGEAMVPVSKERKILGPSILNFDIRGAEFIDPLKEQLSDSKLYGINGNPLGNQYGLTKLMWIQKYQPERYQETYKFLNWSGFVSFLLGAEPVVDYSLANRSLLFDLDRQDWSEELLHISGIAREKLPQAVPSGTLIGQLDPFLAEELGLPRNIPIVAGAHDQCANAVGCGVIRQGSAMFGMGTYFCAVPVFSTRTPTETMLSLGLNTEHHAVAGLFASFIYNQGGLLLKWYRDTYAALEHQQAKKNNRDIYADLIAEVPDSPSRVFVLPHFIPTGPPKFIDDSCGVFAGLHADTTRGEILKGIMEGVIYYLRESLSLLPEVGITVAEYRAVGGGSRSDVWVQLSADILGKPFVRPRVSEAGSLGAAILAGAGTGVFNSIHQGVDSMVKLGQKFEPDPIRTAIYSRQFEKYQQLGPLMRAYLKEIAAQ